MKHKLSTLGFGVSDLARRFDVSRPTVYKYFEYFEEGNVESIPTTIRSFLEQASYESNQNEDCIRKLLMQYFPTDEEANNVETEFVLETIIKNFCRDEQTKSNFLPLVLPTGSRKTTSVINFIADYVSSGGKNNIFFITTLKKNLPVNSEEPAEDMLRKAFNERGNGDLYDRKVMVVSSLSDMLLQNYPLLCTSDKHSCKKIMGDKKIKELENFIRTLNECKRFQNVFNDVFNRFMDFERSFRSTLVRKLENAARTPTERKHLVTTDSDWQWVSEIYPTVYTDEKQIFMMSVAKFVSTHDTIVDGRHTMYDSKFLNNAYVFIDEFDATKDTIISRIIDSDKGNVDYIGIFKRIHETLERYDNIWKEYFREPDSRDDDLATVTMNEIIELKERANVLSKEYNLHCDFKLADSEPLNYIFRDNKILKTGQNDQYVIQYDEVDRINHIRSISSSDSKKFNGKTIPTMLGRLYGFFRHFGTIIYILALNHRNIQDSNGKPISFDSAIRTMLTPYDFTDSQKNYLVEAIKYRPPKRLNRRDRTPDVSFYENGFEFFNLEDNDNHNLSTKIYCTSVKRTPEKILMRILDKSRNAKVIGISATAKLETVIGNYDFRYLNSQEDFREYRIPDEERERLKAMFHKTIDRYDRVNIVTKLFDGSTTSLNDDPSAREEDIVLQTLIWDLKSWLSGMVPPPDNYQIERYIRLFKVYYKFVELDDARSMLCFMNIFPSDDVRFRAEIINNMFIKIIKNRCNRIRSEGKSVPSHLEMMESLPYVVLKSEGFENQKKDILIRLSNGEKIFVLTTYATVGAGQNLQYEIPDEVRQDIRYVSSLANESKINKKDFDAIYLDMPTNVSKSVRESERSDLLAALFDIESLYESREMDVSMARKEISHKFGLYYGVKSLTIPEKVLKYHNYRIAYARRIIQALGRICRTFAKNKNIYVFADDALGAVFKGTTPDQYVDPLDMGSDYIMVNPEFVSLLKELDNSSVEIAYLETTKQISPESTDASAYITSRLSNSIWPIGAIQEWNSVREYVLRFPTAHCHTKLNFMCSMYCTMNEPNNSIRYRQTGDYKQVYITSDGPYEVSQEDARLKDFLKIESVSPLFGEPYIPKPDEVPSEEELSNIPYANCFIPSNLIMSPTLYHNIYKGALGEVSGKAIFESWGIHLNQIDDPKKFEKFDFVTDNDIYVDFKHWAGPGDLDNKKLIEKAFAKLKQIESKIALIVNVLKPRDYSGSSMGYVIEGDSHSYLDKNGEQMDCLGLTVITIPYLYNCDGEEAIVNSDAMSMITKVVG